MLHPKLKLAHGQRTSQKRGSCSFKVWHLQGLIIHIRFFFHWEPVFKTSRNGRTRRHSLLRTGLWSGTGVHQPDPQKEGSILAAPPKSARNATTNKQSLTYSWWYAKSQRQETGIVFGVWSTMCDYAKFYRLDRRITWTRIKSDHCGKIEPFSSGSVIFA